MEQNWALDIERGGRCGYVHYHEGDNTISFYWEYGGGPKTVVYLQGPSPNKWDNEVPWAKGRRIEIMHRIAEESIRQNAPNCVPEYLYDETVININAPFQATNSGEAHKGINWKSELTGIM